MRSGELKPLFDILEQAFEALGIDYYLIGAMAREVWYEKGNQTFRSTKDVDFAVLVGSDEEYKAIRTYLKDKEGFNETKENDFVMFTPDGFQVDILPFGDIELDSSIQLEGTGLTSINVDGFREVYTAGTEQVELSTGNTFKVATLPAIILLKLIAYDDRPELRQKDATDIANILSHFFNLNENFIYDNHNDLFGSENATLQSIGAVVIGREMKKVAKENEALILRLKEILNEHIAAKENSSFIILLAKEIDTDVKTITDLLKNILEGFNA